MYASQQVVEDDALIAVLDQVGLWKDIKEEGGLAYSLGFNGAKLSGGQRQRLNMAALLLSDHEYVLMDEATSAIDHQSKLQLAKLIDEKFKGKTQIIVTHHLASIENADKIIVLHEGEVIDEGRHQELMERCSYYVELVKKGV